jgi:hypothetical protein
MTFLNPWVDPRVRLVRPDHAKAYLFQKGWKHRPYARPQVLLFEGALSDDGNPIVQIVPLIEEADDYVEAVIRLITNLALLEDRYAVDVLNEMLQSAPTSVNGTHVETVQPSSVS